MPLRLPARLRPLLRRARNRVDVRNLEREKRIRRVLDQLRRMMSVTMIGALKGAYISFIAAQAFASELQSQSGPASSNHRPQILLSEFGLLTTSKSTFALQ